MEIRLSNEFVEVSILPLGTIIRKLLIKDKNNRPVNIVCGYDNVEDYQNNDIYLGCTVGRFAGRISGGKFNIKNQTYHLHNNNGVHLHGGKEGFNKKIWALTQSTNHQAEFLFTSPDGEEGYPGKLDVRAYFSLNENQLDITYKAVTDRPTIVNLTNHSYFNLNGSGSILDHQLLLNSEKYLEFDDSLLPTGTILDSKDSFLDFSSSKKIGVAEFFGLDHCLVSKSKNIASLFSPKTGIEMSMTTNQKAIVVYTPKKFDSRKFVGDAQYGDFPAICLEAQNYSDAINQSDFPSPILQPKEEYLWSTSMTFKTMPS